ncbi:quinol---cytochrome-c reductase [Synchytrium endobioticum]|uniref:Cytochrome b-c1 complex subunit Rieske, mitochondrial n=1 Tax=Synchytrium endobioticum TaxID=286115 RepID=A0A507CMH5_9FUNG|nr:quinol---cytochrome-c reductase [Synchytrium endobioticum]TPX48922.1 quinol---cytochrome-c reductase [Synchytrium endobioticum]
MAATTRLTPNLVSRTAYIPPLPLGAGRGKAVLPCTPAPSHSAAHLPAACRPPARVRSASISVTTSYTGPRLRLITQKRYASSSPATVDSDPTHVFTPPPSQSDYKVDLSTYNEDSARVYNYFLFGSMSMLGAAAAKNIVTDFIVNLAASADVLAMAKVEVDMAAIPQGKNVILKWRGKPVFIRHRTPEEIQEANSVNMAELRDPEPDSARVKDPQWLVMLGVCTHLGCVPIGEAGEYGGWFCPCHGSHYDISGRIRKGPAPLNLEVPEYELNRDEGKIVIG